MKVFHLSHLNQTNRAGVLDQRHYILIIENVKLGTFKIPRAITALLQNFKNTYILKNLE